MWFSLERIGNRITEIGDNVYRQRVPQCDWFILHEPEATRQVPNTDDPRWKPIRVGEWWGQDDQGPWAWFRCRVTIPDDWQGSNAAFLVSLGESNRQHYPEALAYVDGTPRQGIDRNHGLIYLGESVRPGDTYDVALEAWRGRSHAEERFSCAELVSVDKDAQAFYYDAKVALDVAAMLPEDDYARIHLINALEESFLEVDFREPLGAEFYHSLIRARAVLKQAKESIPLPARHERVHAIGHAHIDVAWLWPLAQTRQKTARTFSTVLRLMERYPDYHFIGSQAQLYEFIQEDYPEMLEEVRQRAAEGRWEVNGATWVEMDTNVPGGESLVRQFLYGRRFFREALGTEGDVLWLPDVFGYSGSLPQIIRRAGISYFMTTKISWSQYNRFPYDTFYWRGIDGTPVLTHFVTTPSNAWFYTYNGDLTPSAVLGTWQQNRSKDITDQVLMTFGYGDGGGGPTSQMIEIGERLSNHPGAPQVVLGTANDFFLDLDRRVRDKRVPEWVGELYLEYHRGTLTSQAQIKRANRKSEILFHQAEAASAAASLLGERYPADPLRKGWKLILLNQFHDIIPGSSIRAVYEESAKQYAEVAAIGARVRDEALQAIAERIAEPREEGAVAVFSSQGWVRTDLVSLPISEQADPPRVMVDADTGRVIPTQPIMDEQGQPGVLALVSDIPSYGYRTLRWQEKGETSKVEATLHVSPTEIETPFLRITLDEKGHLTSCYDKRAERHVLADDEVANVLQAFEDKPLAHDAWDIDIFYQDKMWVVDQASSIKVIEEGPLRVGLEIRRAFRHSIIVQRIYAYAHTPRLDFETQVDWHERHILLKVAFPVAIHSSSATYEIQFGAQERPTHWNTSWDYARFEVCGHRWADLSEGDYGVSILNDCKYGHDIKGNVMRLTLIKSATTPDPQADQGLHRFTYSLFPHSGDWRRGTVQEAAQINDPLLVAPLTGNAPSSDSALPPTMSLISCDVAHVVIDTVKGAEDGEGIIVRLYEAYNQRGPVTLTFARGLATVWECNLVEENEIELAPEGNRLSFDIKPYQIRTFRVQFAGQA